MTSNDTVLVTGFPGFIAGRLIEKLAADSANIILLVQSELRAKAEKDLACIVESGSRHQQFRIVEGDITNDSLGLSVADQEMIRKNVTSVFHLAAIYDLKVTRENAMRVNLEGTRNVNALVRDLPRLERYNYISTCYVAGKRRGLIDETELRHSAGCGNFYEG